MDRFFNEIEIKQLKSLIKQGLDQGSTPKEAGSDALELMYDRARSRRLEYLSRNKMLMHNLLTREKSPLTVKELNIQCKAFTENVRSYKKQSKEYRKEQRDAFITQVKEASKLQNIWGRAWKFCNDLYWSHLFGWIDATPCAELKTCVHKFAREINKE